VDRNIIYMFEVPTVFLDMKYQTFLCVCMWGGGSMPPEPPRSVMFHVLSTSYNSLLSHKSISSQHPQAKKSCMKACYNTISSIISPSPSLNAPEDFKI